MVVNHLDFYVVSFHSCCVRDTIIIDRPVDLLSALRL